MMSRTCKNSFGDEMRHFRKNVRHVSGKRRSLIAFKGAKRILWSAKCCMLTIMMGMRIHPLLATTTLCVLQKEK
jgi:hypothetical protein